MSGLKFIKEKVEVFHEITQKCFNKLRMTCPCKALEYKFLKIKYRNRAFREFYKELMRIRVRNDPKAAVGGLWETMGRLQFEFLVQQGLKPSHRLLDFGCGCLRGGIYFIKYLNEGNYYGIDISPDVLKSGEGFLSETHLEYKKPVLRNNKDLKFADFPGEIFDFILAQSVLTHMPLSDIEEVFQNIQKVMDRKSVFFATFHNGGDKMFVTSDKENFYYPFNVFREMGQRYGYEVILIDSFTHPHRQNMMRITLQ